MVAEHEHLGDSPERDDAQLEQLLQSAFPVPTPRREYVEALEERLDQQFLQEQLTSEVAESLNGVLSSASSNNGAITLPDSVSSADSSVGPRTGAWLKWGVSLAAAAVLLLAVSSWNSKPAYGWAAMLEALKQCDWMQAVVTDGSERSSGWVSSKSGVWAVRTPAQTAFQDLRENQRTSYHPEHGVVLLTELQGDSVWDWQSLLIAILAEGFDLPEQAKLEALMSARVVSEQWRTVPADNKYGELVELQISLELTSNGHELDLVFLVDPGTHLPVRCRVLGSEQGDPVWYEFSYPNKGPEDIFSLGVPQESRVVDSLASLDRGISRPDQSNTRLGGTEIIEHFVESKQIYQPVQDELTERVALLPGKEPAELPEPLASDELVAQLDTLMGDFWEQQSVQPADRSSDEEFVRRVYLDLTGRIPMVSEVYAFLENESPDRREQLVDDLLKRRDHATHLAAVWRKMLLPAGMDLSQLGGVDEFDSWLADRFGDNMPYDQLAGELLLAEGRVSDSGPILFYAALRLNPEEIAGKTARVFLGTRMECAQCHDHPFDEDISQDEFWGLAAFFAQISRPRGKLEMASPVMRVHDIRSGEVVLPDSDQVINPRLPGTEVDMPAPAEDSSRREQLVHWLASTDNLRFSRATVNRVWEHLFGRGLVNPVDDMRPDNPAVCPEVLDLLSLDFAASGFDLRRLLRALVLTEAYQLSSRAEVDEAAQANAFARMNMKNFSADQLYDCIAVATQNDAMISQNEGEGSLARISNTSRSAFIEQFRSPPGERTDYQAGIPQALTLMNGQLVHGSTDLSSSGLLRSMQAPFFTDQQRLETLFLATLSRMPNEQEKTEMLEYLKAADSSAERNSALSDILWALLNSAEFTFIH